MLGDPTKETVGQFLERWLRDSVAPSVRPSTLVGYTTNVRRHIVPVIGKLPLRKLNPAHLQALYAQKLEEGLAPATVRYIHAALHRALGQAVRWGLLPRNPADAVDRPRGASPDMKVLTPEEAAELPAVALDAGLPRIRFHDLRHTAASLLLAAGEHPKVVQETLGHSSITLTMDTYSHVLPGLKKQAAARMDEILAASKGKAR
jgi:integrase